MSNFTTVNIPLDTVILNSQSLPESLTKIVNNQGLLEEYLETLYNRLEINTVNKSIGEYTPINSINSAKYIVYSTDTNDEININAGIYFVRNTADTESKGYFRPYYDHWEFGTEIMTDKITVNKELVLSDNSSVTMNDVVVNGSVTFKEAIRESVSYDNIEIEGVSTGSNNTLILNKSMAKHIFLTLKFDNTIYDAGGWKINTPIEIKLDISPDLKDDIETNGQIFNIYVKELLDYTDAPIDINYDSSIKFVVGDVLGAEGGIKGDPDNDMKLIPEGTGTFPAFEPYTLINKFMKMSETLGAKPFLIKL